MSKDVCVCFAREDAEQVLQALKRVRIMDMSNADLRASGTTGRKPTPYDAAIRALAEAIMQADSDEQVSSNGH